MRTPRNLMCWKPMLATALLCGCVQSQPTTHEKPFEVTELEAVLAITVDMSGSFYDSWEDRAYVLFLKLMDSYFTESMGSESRVVIAQLSGHRNTVLFEGRPAELRNRFASPEEFNEFLKENSDGGSSPVFKTTEKVVDYLGTMPGVTDNTRVLTVVLSDMIDSELDQQARRKAGQEMVDALSRYRERGGALALYFVDQNYISRWEKILGMAGFEEGHYVIASQLVANPQLPSFD